MEVTYRKIEKQDYDTIKYLINEAFGFGEFIKDTAFLDRVLGMYLQSCLQASSYSQVAVGGGKVVGIILGKADKDKTKVHTATDGWYCIKTMAQLAMASKENKGMLKEFMRIQKTYDELMSSCKIPFQGSIQLFIVAKACRGLGVGKQLVQHVVTYLQQQQVETLYLYTDSRCNYGFYDSQNFRRIKEKVIRFRGVSEPLDVYLYGYKVKKLEKY